MKRRLFTPYLVPSHISREVRSAISKEITRRVHGRLSHWVMLVVFVILGAAVPLMISWLGLGSNVLLFAMVVEMYLGVPAVIVLSKCLYNDIRRSVWLAHGVCPDCGYNLTRNPSGTCSECGADVSPTARRAQAHEKES